MGREKDQKRLRDVKEDIEYCVRYSASWEEFRSHLSAKGYGIQGLTELEITSKDWEFAIPVEKLGMPSERVYEMLERSDPKVWAECDAHPPLTKKQGILLQVLAAGSGNRTGERIPFGMEREMLYMEKGALYEKLRELTHFESGKDGREEIAPGAVFAICESLRELIEESRDEIISPELRHLLTDEKTVDDQKILKENKLYLASDLKRDIEDTQISIRNLEKQKKRIYDRMRRAKNPERKAEYEQKWIEIKKELQPKRQRVSREKKILQSMPRVYALLQKETRYEQDHLSRMRSRSVRRDRDLER